MTGSLADDAALLAGRYRLLERIGAGGMGSVHLAHDEVLDRVVAIKLLHADRHADDAEDEVQRARLRAEARFAGALRHPGIVAIYDYGEEQRDRRVTPYVVMQLVPGRPLSEVLRESGPLPADRVRSLVGKVADALAAAHAAGIVHRDLKPSNILLPDTGQPVIVDFGIARSDEVDPMTRTGEIIGTAAYLSPEQVRGQRATGASDVYALGVIAYRCLTGSSPFDRETHVATALAHVTDGAPPLPGSVPADLRNLVRAMLDQEPARRPDARTVVDHLTDPATGPLPAPSHDRPRRLRRPRAIAVACAGAVLLVAGAIVAVALDGDPATPPAAADLAVPSVRGDRLSAARQELRAAGFEVDVRRVDDAAPAGRVLAQDPAPGPYPGDDDPLVVLRVSTGPPPAPAPTSVATTSAPPPAPTPKAKPKPAPAPAKAKPGKAKGHGKGHGPKHGH
ncbi:protein kinase [Nocardioides sp. MAH-18]|uniref:non-specific serine/threonine protein kinase n=1 Tax=Nocardioides agri TaxID=2682843 RepID=A0A6L6XUE0_9ACTN|nr:MULTISPECIES: serine/threonine protein kinase [unclassified Nocardioides]MBA2955962.1 serine/threonine protein kinase [Nocardioides sp. CGMCC 1.13656]MVQ50810.1 protein kinase [Nocardioides sp. MAH-18]